MALDADLWLDRRRLKRRLALWRTAAVLAVAGLVFLAAERLGALPGEDHVARLTVTGIILEDPARDDLLLDLSRDDSARALVVRIDSPGGSVVGGETLYRSLRAVAAHKPVVAVMGTTATSAAYMATLGADHVIAHDGTLTGSIGVLLQSADVTGLLQKLGVSTEAIKSGPLKAVPSPFEKLTREGRESAQAVVLDMHAFFVDLLAERRGLDRPEALRLADGRVYTGRQALKARLVDAIGTEQDALAWLEATHGVGRALPVRDLSLGYEAGWLVGGLSGLSRKTKVLERLTLDGLISLWHF
ncbi:MAG: signal peptide peptidase SppA [Alphaproteobacteria bacterium]|nr:signal peptide peptidase SppA [Alphaproteobacteria bacterium]